MELNSRHRIRLGQIQPLQIYIAVRCSSSRFLNTFNCNLLYQLFVVSFHCIQTINHVINTIALMRSRITQCHQRMELFQVLLSLLTFYRLRFINDYNRICLCNDINRSSGAKFIQLHINSSGIFSFRIKCLRINNHYIYEIIRGKSINLCQLRRIIDKETNLLSILFCKMLLCYLK